MMSKSQAIRDALKQHGGALTVHALQPIVEQALGSSVAMKRLSDLCSYLRMNGEVIVHGVGDARTFRINPNKKADGQKAVKKKPARKKPKTMRDIVARHTEQAIVSAVTLVQRHVSTTLRTLESVIELDGADPQVVSAFAAHKEAIALMQAAA